MKYTRAVTVVILAALAVLGLVACPNETAPGNNGVTPTPTPDNPWPDEWVTITNNVFRVDTDGNPIFSQGGGIFDFIDPETNTYKHYWYGIRYVGSEMYHKDTTRIFNNDVTFVAVTCYSSMDLSNWKFEGNVLTSESHSDLSSDWVGRMGVAYLSEAKKYVLVVQQGYYVWIAMANSPTEQFVFHRRINMMDETGLDTTNTGDQTVFTDDDGTSYLVYCNGNEGYGHRGRIFVSKIAWDAEKEEVFLANPRNLDTPRNFANPPMIFEGAGSEGNSMFKYEGKYYNTGSYLYGWNASPAKYQVTDNSIVGSYRPSLRDMYVMVNAEKDYSHVSQTGFYYVLKGTKQTTVIYAGDRWAAFAENGIGFNQWVPLNIDGDTVTFNSLSQWMLNPKTGEWKVADGNNYVLNGAFEADRVVVRNIAGWTNSGETSAITNEASGTKPGGKFHMAFTGSTGPFTAGLSQEIELPDGDYIMRADVRANVAGATVAELYAGSATLNLKDRGNTWAEVSLPVTVTGGRITVGARVEGVPGGQWLNFDNISLVKASYVEP